MSKTLDQLTAGLKPLDTVDAVWRQHNSFAKNKNGELIAFSLSGSKVESILLDEKAAALEYLYLGGNEGLKEVVFSVNMPKLVHLNLSRCKELTSLKMPGGCLALRQVYLQDCGLEKLEWEGEYPKLELLDAGNNSFSGIIIPQGLASLKYLYLANNKDLKDLKIEPELKNLEILSLRNNQLRYAPVDTILSSPLKALYLAGNAPKNIPKVFVGDYESYSAYNCLEDALTWFQDLRDYPSEENKVIKLMLTGNGNAGKSTLLCALKNGKCNCVPDHQSTHGVVIETLEEPEVTYNVWDFGGQEVYHGTHRLFVSSEGLQVILFDPETEEKARKSEPVRDRIGDHFSIHHPVDYWFETTQELGPDSRFILVQNKRDQFQEKDRLVQQYADEKKADFVHLSAKTGEGMKIFKAFLEGNSGVLPEFGMLMPESWLGVRQFFIENLKSEPSVKLITQQDFLSLCDRHGVRENTRDLLFTYLRHCGFLYHHQNLGDRIIADQRWALEAIYKPYDREKTHFREFRDAWKGKIQVYRLFEVFGESYDPGEKWLFLSFMESCGLCFKLSLSENREVSETDVFVFPEFLPPDKPDHLISDWAQKARDVHIFRYRLPWPNYYLIQSFITALGRKTKTENIWRNGIHVSTTHDGWFKVEMDYSQRALILSIEQRAMEKWLIAILEEFRLKRDGISWELSTDNGVSFQLFDPEEWKKNKGEKQQLLEAAQERLHEGKVKLTELLPDEPPAPDENIVLIGKRSADPERLTGQKWVLFVTANPEDKDVYKHVGEETRRIKESLKRSKKRDHFLLQNCFATQTTDLRRELLEYSPAIVHFSGHGSDRGEIILEDMYGSGLEVNIRALGNLFKLFSDSIECVVLNACYSELQAKEIAKHIGHVVGLSGKMPRKSEIAFSEAFYDGIGAGRGFKDAFDLGINAIQLDNLEGENIPVLITKNAPPR